MGGCELFKKAVATGNSDLSSNVYRHNDYENYLSCLLFSKRSRESIFAIRAFNVEIAKVCIACKYFTTKLAFTYPLKMLNFC